MLANGDNNNQAEVNPPSREEKMPISYFVQFQEEKPYRIGGEVLFRSYLKENTTISRIEAGYGAPADRMTIYLGSSQIHECIIIEPGPPMTVTFRHLHGRMR